MNSLQNISKLGSNSTQSLSFDDVANYFSLPLSDAATHLGNFLFFFVQIFLSILNLYQDYVNL